MTKTIEELKTAISKLEDGFWDADEVHAFEVRLDAVSSAFAAYLEEVTPSSTADIYECVDLLQLAEVGDTATACLSKLLEFAARVDYGTSCLTPEDVTEATDDLETFHRELKQWFEERHSDS